jgi:hypothetical protein
MCWTSASPEGWDYSPAAGLPRGQYYLRRHGGRLRPIPHAIRRNAPGGHLPRASTRGLLGTFEHNIQNRKRSETDVNWTVTLQQDFGDQHDGLRHGGDGHQGRRLRRALSAHQ